MNDLEYLLADKDIWSAAAKLLFTHAEIRAIISGLEFVYDNEPDRSTPLSRLEISNLVTRFAETLPDGEIEKIFRWREYPLYNEEL